MTPRIGSLCSGYGGLDIATQAVFGGTTAWHCQHAPDDNHQYAAQILTRHWPHIPNHGDITTIDFRAVEPVDILTAGFPCQDVSLAGLRAGLADGTRSGLWHHVARAIETLQPRLVVIENVRGLLSTQAHSDMEPCTWCLGDAGGEPPLRALGAVLADLASLGFDAEWQVVRASDVGAPHQRERVFLLAWPTTSDTDDEGTQRSGQAGRAAERHTAGEDRDPANTQGKGLQGPGLRGHPAECGAAAEDTDGTARGERRLPAPRQAESGRARSDAGGRSRAPDTRRGGDSAASGGSADIQWDSYGPAVHRWEQVLGRPAPRPTDDRGRLSPAFVEWLMGLPAGHVTDTPGLPRSAQLKALGNGVVPQQAAAAIRLLHARATATTKDTAA